MTSKSIAQTVIVISIVALIIMPTSAIKAQTASLTNSSKIQNYTWLLPSDDQQSIQLMSASSSVCRATVTRLESVNINCIIVWAGWWNANHTIDYADSPAQWTQFINTVKAVNPDFMVLALINGDAIDISDSTYTAAMLNAVQQLLASAPFDGLNDDLESFNGTNQNLIDYWQAEANMVHEMGKIATVDLGVDWTYSIQDVYPYLTNFDYIMPMFYWTIENINALGYWNTILSNSSVPVIMGLDVNPADVNESFSQQLSWIDQALASNPHANLAGFSMWAYDYWSETDFTAWANWATKGSVPSPNPSEAPTPSPTPTATSTAAPTPTDTPTPLIVALNPTPSPKDRGVPLSQLQSINYGILIIAVIIAVVLVVHKLRKTRAG